MATDSEGKYTDELGDGETHEYAINLTAGDTLNASLSFQHAEGNLDLVVGRDVDSDEYLEHPREVSASNSDGEQVALTAKTNDTYYIRVTGRDDSTNASYNLTIDRVTPNETDSAEPNWNPASAAEMSEGRHHLNLSTGDTDWYAVDLNAGDTLTVITRFSNRAGNLDMEVRRDTDGDSYYEYIETASSNTDNELVAFTAQENATYYVHVDGRDQYTTSAPYTLVLDRVTPDETAETEPNWDPESAATISEGTYADREITRGDTDWYAINLSAGDTVNVRAAFSNTIGNLDMEVRADTDGDDYLESIEWAYSDTDNEQVAFTARENTTYYIHIDGRNQYTTAAPYNLTVDRVTPNETDISEPNWNPGSAANISEGKYDREFPKGDDDWYALDLNAGDTANISLLFNNTIGNLDMEVRADTDGDDYLESIEWAYSDTDNEQVAFTARKNTTYYIHVDGRNQYTTNTSYSLTVDRVTPNETDRTEPQWSPESAATLDEGQYDLEFRRGDDDWYAVDLNAGDTLNVTALFNNSDGNLDLAIRSDTDGDDYLEQVEYSSTNSDTEQTAFTARKSTTYYIHIDGRNQYTTNTSYSLIVDRVTPNENDPTEPTFDRDSAAPISAAGPNQYLTRGDVDWYVIPLQAGETFSLTTAFDHSVGDLELQLYGDEDGDGDLDYLTASQSNTDNETIRYQADRTGYYYLRVYGDDDDTTAAPYEVSTNSTADQPPVNVTVHREELPNGQLNLSFVVTNTQSTDAAPVTLDIGQIGGDWTIESRSSEGGQWSSDFAWQWDTIAGGETKRASIVLSKRVDGRASPRVATVTVSNSSARTDAEIVSLWGINASDSDESLPVRIDWTPASPTTDEDITFNGTVDSNATGVTYHWDLDSDGTIEQTGETATRSFPVDGAFPVKVTVTDDNGNTNSTTQFVEVTGTSDEPNDAIENATRIIEGQYERNISSGDIDWYAIELEAGETVNASLAFTHDTGNLDLMVARNTDTDDYLEERWRSTSNSDGEQVAFTATANDTYYVRVNGRDDSTTAPYTLSIDRVTPNETDASEPHWSPDSAANVSEGRYDREFTTGDDDWYAMDLNAGDTLSAAIRFSNDAGNLDLRIRADTDNDGYLEYVESAYSNTDNEQVAFTARENTTYYVHIEGRNQFTTSAPYTLILDRVTPNETDASEPTWNPESADRVTEGNYDREITRGDTDWYAIDLNAGDTANISALFNNEAGNLDLRIRADTDGDGYLEYVESAYSDTDNEQVAFTARENTTYYIHIEGRHQYTTSAPYTLSIDRVTPNETDSTEPQWDPESATVLEEGRYNLEFRRGDDDWYAIDLNAGDTANIRALFDNSEGNLDLKIRADTDNDDYLESIEWVYSDTDNEQVAFTARQTGTYYINIDGRNQYTTNTSYTLAIDRVTPAENDASEPTFGPTSAAPVTSGTLQRNLTRGDVDWYVVSLSEGERLETVLGFDHSEGNLDLRLRSDTDDDGYLEYIDDSTTDSDNESISHQAETSGLYYLRVTGRDDDTTAAPYDLTVNTSGAKPPVAVQTTTEQRDDGTVNLTITVTNTQPTAAEGITVDAGNIGGNWRVVTHSSEGGQWSADISWQWDTIAANESKRASLILEPRTATRSTPRFAVVEARNGSATTDVSASSLWVGNRNLTVSLQADFDWQPVDPVPGEAISFNATPTEADADIAAYRWDTDSDGIFEQTGTEASRSFPITGRFPVQLEVENADGQTDRVTKYVTVGDADIDATSPNDEQANATQVLEGAYVGNVTAGDQDWYAVELDAGDTLNVSLGFTHDTGNLDLMVARNTDTDDYLEERWRATSNSDGEQVAFTATANDTYYIRVIGRDDSTTAPYTLRVDRTTPAETDSSEPNWAPEVAANISEGRHDRELIRGDDDWYAMGLDAGDTLSAAIRFSDDAGNLDLRIRADTDGDGYLEYVESSYSNTDNEQVAFTARENTTYYVHIEGRNQYTTAAPYTLVLDRVTPNETDASEPTWNPESADPVTEGSYDREITRGDTDWYAIDLNAGDTANISALFNNEAGNLNLRVRADTDGDGYLEYVESAYSNTDNEQVAFTARKSTTYYIHVEGRNQYTTSAPYTLSIDRVTPNETDPAEPNWDADSASLVTEGKYAREFTTGDDDWYAINLNAGDTADIRALFNNSEGNLDLRIRADTDSDGYLEYVESSYSETDNEQVAFTARQTGTYYIHIDGRNQYTTNTSYTLAVDRVTPEENDLSEPTYSITSADPVTNGTYNRTVTRGDVDWYVIGLSEGETLNTTVRFDNSVGNLDLVVRSDTDDDGYLEGIEYASTNSDNEQATFTAQETGVYYLRVSGRDDDRTTAPYELVIDRDGGDPAIELDMESRRLPNGSVNISLVVTNTKDTAATDVTLDGDQIGGNWRVVTNSSEGGVWGADITWQWDSIPSGESRRATLVLSPRSATQVPPRFAIFDVTNATTQTDIAASPLWHADESLNGSSVTAAFDWEPQTPEADQTVTFDGNNSSANAEIAEYRWDLDNDGTIDQYGPTATQTFDSPGEHLVSLQVQTINGTTDTVTRTVTVTGNQSADFQIQNLNAPSTGTVGENVVVSAQIVNTGNLTASKNVTFSYEEGAFAGTGTRNITLEPGESTWVSLTYGDDIEFAGEYNASISTDDDSVQTTVEFTDQQFVCGVSTGDPHFVTFDGVAYDFQGVGEFTLARANGTNGTGDLVVQVRHVPVAGSTSVSITNATATVVDGHQVQIDAADADPLSIDGQTVTLADGESVAVGNGTVKRNGNSYTVVYPGSDGVADATDERLQVDVYGNRIDLKLCLDPTREATVGGLLGSPDGNASNDFALRNGTVIGSDIDTKTLYGAYRDSWQVTNETTVFTYENGKDPSFYYFPNYPERIVTLADLNETVRERAEELALEAGLEPGTAAFRDAVIDYALTGDSSYFASATTSSTSNVTSDAGGPGPLASAVELRPTNATTTNSTNVTYEVIVTDAYDGVGAYNLTVSVANGSVGTVTNATAAGSPDLSNVTVAADGTSVEVKAALADTPDTGEVTVATVTVRATGVGTSDVALSVDSLGNETGDNYNMTRVSGASLEVNAIGKLRESYAGPPTDPDNDGVYEDINGDGKFNIVDVQALYTLRDDEVVQNNAAAFNINGDTNDAGEPIVDIVDVQALYVESHKDD